MDLLVAGLNGSGRLLGLHQGITVLRAQLRAARGRPRRQWRLTVDIIKARLLCPLTLLCVVHRAQELTEARRLAAWA